jgi:NADH-quinone oxidoreductase subunit G
MPELVIDGRPVHAEKGQTVIEAARAAGIDIPHFCWHPRLSVAGNCRICLVEVEEDKGGAWTDIACNMPVTEGMRVRTDTEAVRARRKEMLEFITLNHPVDCGICDKSGECKLQDYHYAYNGAPSASRVPKVHASKLHALSSRVLLDNERCILCSRCVRFTHEVSKSHSLGILRRGDHSLVRATEDGRFQSDPYSENVVDLCPVGALLSRSFLYQARVWYLDATPSVCPACERGCNVYFWHRKPEWFLRSVTPEQNRRILRITPRENAAVNGLWMCNTGRDVARVLERPRAMQAKLRGTPVSLAAAITAARELIVRARRPVALVSSWGSNEELDAFRDHLAPRFASFVKQDRERQPGEVLADELLIRADKNPNTAGARARFAAAPLALAAETDLVLVWGEGFDSAHLPPGARVVRLNAWQDADNDRADVFLPISLQTERQGHYTNFAGVTSAFAPCFAKPEGVVDAAAVFASLAAESEVAA